MHSKVHFTLPHVPKHKYLLLKIQIQLHIIFTLPLEFTLLVKLIKKKKHDLRLKIQQVIVVLIKTGHKIERWSQIKSFPKERF